MNADNIIRILFTGEMGLVPSSSLLPPTAPFTRRLTKYDLVQRMDSGTFVPAQRPVMRSRDIVY